MANSETLIIDVRPDSMREESGYFECSTQLVYSQMGAEAFNEEVKRIVENNMDHPILVYCASSESSMNVKQSCLDAGFTNVKDGAAYEDLLEEGCACPPKGFFF